MINNIIKKRFFVLYFLTVFVVFIIWIFHAKIADYTTYDFGNSIDKTFELKKGTHLEQVINIPEQNPHGFRINSIQRNDIEYKNESIYVEFSDEDTGKVYQRNNILLRDQFDEKNIYIPFEDELRAGTRLHVSIWSEGLGDEGPLLSYSNSYDYPSLFIINGLPSKYSFGSSLCYRVEDSNYLKPIIYFVIELLIGFFMLYLHKIVGLPIIYGRRHEEGVESKKNNWVFSRKSMKKIVTGVGSLCVISFVFFEFISYYCVEPAAGTNTHKVVSGVWKQDTIDKDFDIYKYTDLEFLDALKNYSYGSYKIQINEGDTISQIFYSEDDNLSGISVQLPGKLNKKGNILYKLYDVASGRKVDEGSHPISLVMRDNSYLAISPAGKQRDDVDKMQEYLDKKKYNHIARYLGIEFRHILEDSQDKYYRIELSFAGINDGPVSIIAEAGDENPVVINGKNTNLSLCILSSHQNYRDCLTFYHIWCVLTSMFLIIVYLLIRLSKGISFERLFFVGMMFFGVSFMVIIPPYCVPDEQIHIDSSYRVSNSLLGIDNNLGPDYIYKRRCDIDGSKNNTMSVDKERYLEICNSLKNPFVDENERELLPAYGGNAISNATILNYLPCAIGMTIGRILHLNLINVILLGRFFNLLVCALIVTWTLSILPFGKEVSALVILLPISLQQTASCSYDGLLTVGLLMFVSVCFAMVYDNRCSVINWLILFFTGFFVAVCKGGSYIPILGVSLLIPFGGEKVDWTKLRSLIAVYLGIIGIFIGQCSSRLVSLFFRSASNAKIGVTDHRSLYTLGYLITHPIELIRIFETNIIMRTDLYISTVTASGLGAVEIMVPWFLIIAFLILIILASMRSDKESLQFKFKRNHRLWVGFLCLISYVLICLSMLIVNTSFGSRIISGVQGRYFLPFLPPLFLLLSNNRYVNINKDSIKLIYTDFLLLVIEISMIFMKTLS